ncbi:Large ribosomal subunit protein uL23m [Plasmodiophora brassicae]|uniref:Large ribosomal subunit protein uL23m n=1 Tax=Plasmodiophora brassicae TaxID=37360 RepID=A0A0G4IK15_PLABS|nr:hypothetical protein PBRA_004262 [Plasmodiophora brassicae]
MVRKTLLSATVMLVKSSKDLGANKALFRVPVDFGKKEIAAYLRQLYNLPVARVNTLNRLGATRRALFARSSTPKYYKRPDVKLAYVTFASDVNNPFAS